MWSTPRLASPPLARTASTHGLTQQLLPPGGLQSAPRPGRLCWPSKASSVAARAPSSPLRMPPRSPLRVSRLGLTLNRQVAGVLRRPGLRFGAAKSASVSLLHLQTFPRPCRRARTSSRHYLAHHRAAITWTSRRRSRTWPSSSASFVSFGCAIAEPPWPRFTSAGFTAVRSSCRASLPPLLQPSPP